MEITESQVVEEFNQKEREKNNTNQVINNEWKKTLKQSLDYLFSKENLNNFATDYNLQARFKALDPKIISSYNVYNIDISVEELYLKMNLVRLIKKAYLNYPGYYSDFKETLCSLLEDYLIENQLLVYYSLDACGFLFTNKEIKCLLKSITSEGLRKPQVIIDSTKERQKLFRKEFKYERSKSSSTIA